MHQLTASEASGGARTAGRGLLSVGLGPVRRGGHWRRLILPIRDWCSMVLDHHAATRCTASGDRSTVGPRRRRR